MRLSSFLAHFHHGAAAGLAHGGVWGRRCWAGGLALAWLAALTLTGCGPASPAEPPVEPPARPQRIVSLDYCADQFVLKLADRAQIAAVSIDADADFSFMRAAVGDLPQARATGEDVLARRPDLVVRSYGGEANIGALLGRAGVPVAQLGWAGDFQGVRANIRAMAAAFGHPERGEALIAEMDARLAAAAAPAGRDAPRALYLTPAGFTTGEGSLVHEMLETAGLRNFETEPGWRPIPLERLARERPDMVVAAFFESRTNLVDSWSAARHPVAQRQMRDRPTAPLQGAWTACGGWFLADGVETLARTRLAVERAR